MSAGVWAHCVICKTLARELNGVSLLITSCGRLLCRSCCPRLGTFSGNKILGKNFEDKFARSRDTSCRTCVGGCNTVEMNGKAPSNIQNLFKDVSSQMKFIVKTLDWQDAQKKSIVEHKVITTIEADSLIAIEMSK